MDAQQEEKKLIVMADEFLTKMKGSFKKIMSWPLKIKFKFKIITITKH